MNITKEEEELFNRIHEECVCAGGGGGCISSFAPENVTHIVTTPFSKESLFMNTTNTTKKSKSSSSKKKTTISVKKSDKAENSAKYINKNIITISDSDRDFLKGIANSASKLFEDIFENGNN